MKLFKSKVWSWWDVSLLKWCCILLGMLAGAYLADVVKEYVWWFVAGAVLLGISPAISYFKR